MSGGKEHFRVTDLHLATGVAPIYAACRGRACFQAVRDGGGNIAGLNLILQPLVQLPFEFPHVEYFIYRGVDPLSVLNGNCDKLDLANEGTAPNRNDLIGYIREKVLKQAAASTTPTPEELKYLGLDRTGIHFGDDDPLDHLFRYSGGAELPIVEAGWKLGDFVSGTNEFGFEVVVQSYGAQPKLSWVRKDVTASIEAIPLASSTTPADLYQNKLQREEIGCFVDPCAFWGMFYRPGLWLRSAAPAGETCEKKNGLCTKLFATSGIFVNSKRVYVNVRNEVGLSYDFYGSYLSAGLNFGVGSTKDNLFISHYGKLDWPLHYLENYSAAPVWVQLGVSGNPHPLLFLQQAGTGGAPQSPFRDIRDANDPVWSEPVKVRRPMVFGGLEGPPWWFAVHLLRGRDGQNAPAAVAGAFDTSPLQFGPIGDRVIAAYKEMWPGPASNAASGYKRVFVSDKVWRHDGTVKSDPVDPTRSLSYDRVGDTSYIFQRGVGSDAGKDSALIVQRRSYGRKKDTQGSWMAPSALARQQVASSLLFNGLSGAVLSQPIDVHVTGVPNANETVPSFEEVRSDTALKTELFDYTYLLLSKTAFAAAVAAAKPVSTPSATTEKHPAFLSLNSEVSLNGGTGYTLNVSGWNSSGNSALTGANAYSADGVFFSSADFDSGGLLDLKAYVMTPEEAWRAPIWDSWINQDTLGTTPGDQMPGLVDAFVTALAAASALEGGTMAATTAARAAAFSAAVELFAKKIWDRAVTLIQIAAYQERVDRILYCTRLKMEVALKSNLEVRLDPVLKSQLIERFEALSRNFAGLTFTPSDVSSGKMPVLVTGFDPFGKGDLDTNPSGQLALYFAATANQSYISSHTQTLRTCIFPNRWSEFDTGLVEKVISAAVPATHAATTPSIICTCSLDPNIQTWICDKQNNRDFGHDIHENIDRYATQCIRAGNDNNNELLNIRPNIPAEFKTDNKISYENKLRLQTGDLSRYDSLPIKLRHNEAYHFIIDYKLPSSSLSVHDLSPYSLVTVDGVIILDYEMLPDDHKTISLRTTLSTTGPPATIFNPGVICLKGSGGSYLSNEIHYRVANLIQSGYATDTPLHDKYNGILNGHIHVPNLGSYDQVDLNTKTGVLLGTVTLPDLAKSIIAMLDGVLWP
jgi:hypothetical protein